MILSKHYYQCVTFLRAFLCGHSGLLVIFLESWGLCGETLLRMYVKCISPLSKMSIFAKNASRVPGLSFNVLVLHRAHDLFFNNSVK